MKYFIVLAFSTICISTYAQEKWDLRRCVDYAMQNSISVKQADVQARIAALQTKLANAQAYPNLLFNTQIGVNSGRSIDPTSNLYTTQQIFFQSLGLQSGVTLFNFFSIKNNRLSARLDEEAYKTGVDRARNDIALNVAASYLQYLLSIEQANITKIQIQQTRSQLDNTRKLVDAGSMPELNAAQLEAQLAKDSSNYITAKGTADQNRISLMGLLNLDAAASFEAATPDVDKIPIEPLAELDPAFVYNLALTTQPLQKKDSLHIKAAEYAVKSARGAMYPTLSAFAALNSNYASTYSQFTGLQPTGKFDTVAIVPVGATNYYALTPGYNTITSKVPYFKQVSDINFSQAVGIQLNIPIANNRQLRNNYERAKLNVENLRLQLNQDNITLQQNIYTAYSNAVSALEKYNANIKAYKIQQYAFELSKKRYEIGVLSTIDYITTQNNLFSAEIDQVSAKYDYIFKMKVLEFYKGQGVKL